MNKKLFTIVLAALLVLGAAGSASAQLRLDMDVNVPAYVGFTAGGTATGAWNQFFIPFPDAQLSYQFALGPVRLGAGVRVFTLIIESFLYPEVYAELDLKPLVLSAKVGGLGILEFGLLTDVLSAAGLSNLSGFQSIVFPDLSIAYSVNDWFRIAAGLFVIAPFGADLGGIFGNNLFAGYVAARFVILFK
jgi:hypothetical protein